jgi:hypothetical protein
MSNPAVAGLSEFRRSGSNVAIIFGVIFFINVNSGDLIFDFSVSRHRETSADFAGFPIFLAIRRIAYEFSCRVPRFSPKKGQQNSFHVEA